MSKILNILEEARQSRALFLLLIVLINILLVYFFAIISLRIGIEGKFFTFVIAIINGFFTWFFMHNSNRFQLFIYSIFFSYLSYLFFNYLIFMHLFHWQSNLLWDKSIIDNTLIYNYIISIGKYTLKSFFEFFGKTDSLTTYVYIALHLIPLFIYRLLPEYSFSYNNDESKASNRLIKRRFK